MSWNHRVLAHQFGEIIEFRIHEVYYTNGVPDGYTTNPVSICSEDIKGMLWTLNKMKECLKKPVLWAGDKFPNEFKE